MTSLLLAGGLAGFLLLSALISKAPKVVLYATTALIVIVWDFPMPLSVGSVGGTSVQVEDALMGAMVLTTLLRPQRFLAVVKPYLLVVLISGIAVIASLLYGIKLFGPSAVNEFRSFLYPLAAVAWGLNQDWGNPQWQGIMRRWAIFTGSMLSLVALFHAALYGLGKVDSFVHSVVSGVEQTGRPLTAGQAIVLALCALYTLHGLSQKSRGDLVWACLFVGVVLVAQHRSVWIAFGVGCAILFFKVHGMARRRLVTGAVVAGWLGFLVVLAGFVDVFTEQLAYSVDNTGTYDARTSGWGTLIDQTIDKGMGPIAFGSPFGSGYARVEKGILIQWAPHNWYVTVYLRLGLIALIAFAILLLLVLARLLKTKGVGVAAAVFVATLSYCWAYSLPWQIAPFFAWAMYSAGKARRERQAEKAPKDFLPAAYQKRDLAVSAR